MGSTRLPGKVALRVGDKCVLEWVVHRVRLAQEGGTIAVVTSVLLQDDAIEALCSKIDIPCFRGSELDLVDRYRSVARSFQADAVVRVTADCPLLDPALLDTLVETHRRENADYVSMDGVPRGFAQETFSATALERVWKEATLPYDREHVGPYVFGTPSKFRTIMLPPPPEIARPELRITLDTEQDFELLEGLYHATAGTVFDLTGPEIVAAVAESPRLLALATRGG